MVPFSSYDNLIANIAETLNRQDLVAAIPGFIALVEGRVNADDRFRILPSMQRSTAILSPPTDPIMGSFIPMPADYISMQNFRLLQVPPPGSIELLTTTQMDEKRALLPDSDQPKFYCVTGEEFEIRPMPDTTYTAQMIYFANVPPLGTSNESNWLLQRYPNVYYYGALMEAAPYLRNDERVGVWGSMYEKIANDINVSSDRGQFSGATMKMRTPRRYR